MALTIPKGGGPSLSPSDSKRVCREEIRQESASYLSKKKARGKRRKGGGGSNFANEKYGKGKEN